MEHQGVAAVSAAANRKLAFFTGHFARYLVYAIMAGVFCGLGMILSYSAGAALDAAEATRGFARIVFSLSFGLSFTLIVYAGAELFTGNVLVMTMGGLNGTAPPMPALGLLGASYLGNFLGAGAISLVIWGAGLLDNPLVGQYLCTGAAAKMALPFGQALLRGVLCNLLVCLATWATSKLSSEPAKMMLLLWCVYCFCAAGFEHSIANMALFVMALVSPFAGEGISAAGALANLIPVTLGNLLGGALIGGVYFFIGSAKDQR